MTPARLAAAVAGMLTALLLQAAVVAPVAFPWPVSLVAVLVAAIGLCDGPASGMSFGFAAGLLADLGSHHPAGLLALTWLGVGLLCGLLAERRSTRRDALLAGVVSGIAGIAASVALIALDGSGSLRGAVSAAVPTVLVSAVLALGVVPLVRAMTRTNSLRAPQPVRTELAIAGRHE